MQIWVHDTRMRKVTAINNAIPRMLSFYNSTWHRYLPQATNTFDFTIPKLYSGKLHEDLSFINDRAYFSFRNQGKNYVFYVANMVEDDFSIQLTCNDTNLELNNEQVNAFSSDSAQTLAWYLEHMDLLAFTSLKIGINEISDRKRTLTFDSQETKFARLQSLMSQFDAEYEFVTELNNNGTLKQITLNIYQSPDSTHHGVGKVRSDVLLYYGNDVKGVQVTTDKTQLFNMAVFTGQDGLSMKDVERSDKNEDGKEEFYTRKGNEAVYAPLSAEMYPSTLRDGDNWTRKDFQTEYTDVNDLTAYAFRTMKQYAYPIITYTASVQSNFLGNYSDLALGDTVKIYDGNFVGGLALEARVTEQIISFDNPNNNSLVFSNYVKLKNTVSATLQKRLAELVEANTPYTIKLARNNSLIFKNGQGETIITPSLYKADKPITADVTWRWSLDGNVTNSMIYTVKGADVTEQSVLTVAAYIGNDEVATTEIDVINVNDGADGVKGDKGDDGAKGDKGETGNGIANTVITYGLSTSETTEPATWSSNMPVLVKGMYLWTRTVQIYTNGTSSTSYQKGYIAKDGDQGLPGAPGTDGKTPYIHFAYADDNKGTNLSFTDKNQQYQGYYSDYTEANSTDYKKYTWVDRLANVKGGSRNYFKNSLTKTFYTTDAQTFDWRTYIVDAFWKNKDRFKKNFVKISFDITFPVALENDYTANIHFSATPWYSNRVTFKAGTTSRQHFEFGIDLSSASEDYHTDNVFIRFGTNYGFPSGFKTILENMMLSIGSYYPDYIQAIEDTQEQIDSKADSALTQEQLNALEAKRLQMEVELKAKATLEQVSELETFINNLKQEDSDGRQKIIEITKAIEERVKDIEPIMEYSQKLQFMDTYITQGNGGMIIGANESTTKVVVTPDRISFQSGGSEVAYISQRMLHIDNGVFTLSLQLGHYITRAHPKNEYVNATYFVK